jgi:hypothetical protein
MDFAGFIERLRKAPYPVPTLTQIPPAQCLPAGTAGTKIPKDEAYFSLRINEVSLESGRTDWNTFDPMAVVLTEFVYGNKVISVPFVVGSDLFKQANHRLPHGLLFRNILACGPHPFRGGNVAISLVLYKVKRDNYAKGLLKFIQGVSSAVGAPADIGMLTKVGEALVDGLDTLLNMSDTVPLLGQRLELSTATIAGLTSTYWLLSDQKDLKPENVKVENGEVFLNEPGQQRLPPTDYVLYSIEAQSRRGDESKLPFYPMRKQAFDAVPSGDEGWTRAKALLLAMYTEMMTSDDIVAAEAEDLFEKYKAGLLLARDKQQKSAMLTLGEKEKQLDAAAAIMEL